MSNLIRLEHNGVLIRNSDDGDFHNLTDMWRACGGDSSKRPDQWLRYAGKEFIEFIGENLKAGNPSIELIRTVRGGTEPGTWAHWQIALAYAKYLSHEFHAQCNTVIRAFAEGKLKGGMAAKAEILAELETRFGAMFAAQTDGIAKQLAAYRDGTKEEVKNLAIRLDSIDRHPNGLLGDIDAVELRRQINLVAHARQKLGEAGAFVSIYRRVDDAIRREVGYPNEKGAKWELCPAIVGMKAFSRVGMMFHSVSADLSKKKKAEDKAFIEKQMEIICKKIDVG